MENPQHFCRLCAKCFEEPFLLHIFQRKTSCTVSLHTIVNKYMPFKVTADDNLPLKVCKICGANVIKWHRFVTLCVKSQVKLKDKWQEKNRHARVECLGSEGSSTDNEDTLRNATPQTIDSSPQSLASGKSSLENPVIQKKITNYCIARWCNNGNNVGISLFRIPKDRSRALQWLSASDRMDLADKDTAVLHRCYMCAAHFEKKMFVNEHCKSINRNAVPSIFYKPTYAEKINQGIIEASTYPKELQGVRLKYILPKVIQKPQEVNKGSSMNQSIQQKLSSVIAVLPESKQEFLEQGKEAEVFGNIVTNHPSVHIFDVPSNIGDPSGGLPSLEKGGQENYLQDQCKVFSLVADINSGCRPENVPSDMSVSIKDEMATELSDKQGHEPIAPFRNSITYLGDTFRVEEGLLNNTQMTCASIVNDNSMMPDELSGVEEKPKTPSCIPNNLLDLINPDEPFSETGNVMLLDLNSKSTNTNTASPNSNPINFCDNRHETSGTFGSQVASPGNSFASLTSAPSFPPGNSLAVHDDVGFALKDTIPKPDDLARLNNVVGSQDFLLMHSSASPVRQTQEQRLMQGVKNLCCTIDSESVSEPISYDDRAMMAEVTARSMECTSPNHGQTIEGLIDLDQFLDSA